MTAMQLMQELAWRWAARCFGVAHVQDTGIRALRLAEEAVELAQALDVPRDRLHSLIDIVYDKASWQG